MFECKFPGYKAPPVNNHSLSQKEANDDSELWGKRQGSEEHKQVQNISGTQP